MGLTRQEYRTALNVLIVKGILEKIENCRNRKKSTTGSTTIGTLVKLCNSDIYDINFEEANHRPHHRPTTDQPPTNHEQERIRKKKKEEEQPPPTPPSEKIRFRENVQLTQAEHATLLAKHGQAFLDQLLDILDAYKGSSGKSYKSDYHTMKEGGWVVERAKKDLSTAKPKATHEKTFYASPASLNGSTPRYQPGKILRGNNVVEGDKVSTNG